MSNIINFEYNAEDAKPEFKVPTPGKHRVRIKEATVEQSKAGKDMIVMKLEVNNFPGLIYHYLVIDNRNEDVPTKSGDSTWNPYKMTQQSLRGIYDSFAKIPVGSMDLSQWIGTVGGAELKVEAGEKGDRASVKWFLALDLQAELPAWGKTEADAVEVDDECPF